MRKAIMLALYDKLAKLSLKSLSQTSSGKIITLISADIFVIERMMQFTPLMISVPIVNLAAYAAIWVISGW